jgi:PAS domain S-box-containing protein
LTGLSEFRSSKRESSLYTGRISLVLAYAAALVFPLVSAVVTSHLPILDHIPAALFLASIALTAWFGYVAPAAVCIVLSLGLYNVFIAPPIGRWSIAPDELVREAVIALVAGLIGFLIVGLRRAQAALSASEAFYRTTLSSIGDAVIATDMEGAVTFMNPIAEQLTGWAEAEAKGQLLASFFKITNEETGEAVENPVDKVRRLGTVVGMANHTFLERRDGTRIPIDDSGAPILTAEGQSTGIVLVFRDVKERRQTEREQQLLLARARAAESETRELLTSYEEQAKSLELAQQAGKSAAWVMDVEKEEVKWLPGGFEIFGMPFAEFVGRVRPISLVEQEDRPGIEAALKKTIETGAPFTIEFRIRWPNGELHCQEARGILDAENRNIIRGTTFDITERKNAEFGLLRIEKLAAVGKISSTIAHEINNPLAAVTNLLYLALLETSLGAVLRGYLVTAQEELARLSNITRLTLSYSRSQTQPREVDPVEIIENVLSLFRIRLEAKGIQLERAYPDATGPESVRVLLFADELQRIITNLLANAIDAVASHGGRLRIVAVRQGEEVLLTMEDNGCGIPEDRRERIFEPFFTTKEEVGTGIGLWVTKDMVEKNGGSISFVSGQLDDGFRTRFELRFPMSAANEQTGPGQAA